MEFPNAFSLILSVRSIFSIGYLISHQRALVQMAALLARVTWSEWVLSVVVACFWLVGWLAVRGSRQAGRQAYSRRQAGSRQSGLPSLAIWAAAERSPLSRRLTTKEYVPKSKCSRTRRVVLVPQRTLTSCYYRGLWIPAGCYSYVVYSLFRAEPFQAVHELVFVTPLAT